jgi:hypothetical protein
MQLNINSVNSAGFVYPIHPDFLSGCVTPRIVTFIRKGELEVPMKYQDLRQEGVPRGAQHAYCERSYRDRKAERSFA